MNGRHQFLVFSLILALAACGKSPDRFALVNGKKIHILDRGEGSPTVVFLTGAICPLEHFYTVQSRVSMFTRTFNYDRSGLGLSDILDTIRTYDHVATELNTILEAEKIPTPYILVAHSYGGGLARQYYSSYPEKVAGFVFVDCANDEVFFDSLLTKGIIQDDFGPDSIATEGERYEMIAARTNLFWFKKPFSTNLPVQLLIASGPRAGSPEMIALKVKTYQLFNEGSANMKTTYATQSTHHIQRDQPELVTKAIEETIELVRKERHEH